MAQQGEDVTALMNTTPESGEDVTDLMSPVTTEPGEDVTALMGEPEPVETEEPGMLGKALDWGLTSLIPSLAETPSYDESMEAYLAGGMEGDVPRYDMSTELGKGLTSPLGIAGEVVGGLGLIKGLRGLRGTSKLRGLTRGADEVADVADVVGDMPIRPPVEDAIAPGTSVNIATGEVSTPAQKLSDALLEARPLTKEQRELISEARSAKATAAERVTIEGEGDVGDFMRELQGPTERVKFDPLRGKLEQPDVDDLFKQINNADIQTFEKARGYQALGKVLEGEVPQPNEIRLLEDIFGESLPIPGEGQGMSRLITEAVNLPRAIQSSMDISAPFRQGLGLIHTKAWWTSWDDMLKSFGSEKAYDGVMSSIRNNPTYRLADEAGVKFTDLRGLTNREEAIMNTWAEKIPFIRRSNRAYTAFLNKLRMDEYANMVNNARTLSETAIETAGDNPKLLREARRMNPEANPEMASKLADFINNASGRGDLGKAEKYAQELNTIFYSPRFIASRVQMMRPKHYMGKDPFVRKQYLKSMAALTGTWSGIAGMAALAGASVGTDTTSADFGKIRIGDTRIDPAGGFQQYLVLFNRLAQQEQTSSTSGKTREFGEGYGAPTTWSTLERFGSNKLQPLTKFAYDMLNAGEDQPFNALDRTAQLFIPMIIQDVIEVSKESPELLPLAIPATAVGMGSSTYGGGEFGEPDIIGEGALFDPF